MSMSYSLILSVRNEQTATGCELEIDVSCLGVELDEES